MAKKKVEAPQPINVGKTYQEVIDIVTNTMPDVRKTDEDLNRAAGRRVRKALQEVAKHCKTLRKAITELTKKD